MNFKIFDDYIKEKIPHNKKLISGSDSIEAIFEKYNSWYGNNFQKIPLKIDDHYLHINYQILEPLLTELNYVSKLIESSKSLTNKRKSLFKAEMFNNHLIEGYISSKRILNSIFEKNNHDLASDQMVINIFNSMEYVLNKQAINKDNLLILYKRLTANLNLKEATLDGDYYRLNDVYISNHDQGVKAKHLDGLMDDLFIFINDQNNVESKIIKAIIIHFYFEYLHPYYDFNGRTGRLLVLWFANNFESFEQLSFFATAINLYRTTYLKAFKRTRYNQTIDLTYFVAQILNILIKQKQCYFNLVEIKKLVQDQFELSSIQKDVIMLIQANHNSYLKNQLIEKIFKLYEKDQIEKSIIEAQIDQLLKYQILDQNQKHYFLISK